MRAVPLVIDASPCTVGWSSAKPCESYTRGHACKLSVPHSGSCVCTCGATRAPRELTEREQHVLRDLRAFALRDREFDGWARPMDIGATDASHHSRTLRKLEARGLVERRLRPTLANERGSSRGSCRYRAIPGK